MRHSSHKYKPRGDVCSNTGQICFRKMFAIMDQRGRLLTHSDGHLMLFYRSRDARKWLENNDREDSKWELKVQKVQINVTQI